ncbi:DUF2156 domain-containing protein [Brooklawnia cerclae]|uniref:Lysylphosphatidylglycerol synthetase-like protein (DUF2156 family) n=1 Tax=Brooklawnia cerclae TaxID=349934 RepID=A0ABX0SMX4_9ACTN|nr:DUF2156 domain-containing protein [Brooklawnia cerclae]NIH58116.1 lysylphosphatidylglycerol synthetase-like protein (DUF2156 family) [Brooklawnia cerclae]
MTPPSRTSLPWRRLWTEPRRAPASYVILAVVIVVAVFARMPATADTMHQWFALTWGQLAKGRIWTPLTALLLPGRVDGLVLPAFALTLVLPQVERAVGTRRVLVGYFALGAVSAALGAGFMGLLAAVHEPWASVSAGLLTGDPTIGVVAALAYAAGAMSPVWRRRTLVATAFASLVLFLYSGQPGDLYRLVAFCLGAAIIRARVPRAVTAHEVRVTASALVLALAVGPLVAVVSRIRLGLLSPSVLLVDDTTSQSDVPMCSVFKIGEQCWDSLILGQSSSQGPWVWVQLLALVPLALAAWGLMRGRRAAVWVAVVLIARTVVSVAASFAMLPAHRLDAIAAASPVEQVELIVQVAAVLLVHMAAAAWLIVQRRRFQITLSRDEDRAALRSVAVVLIAAGVAMAGFVFALRSSFAGPPSILKTVLAGLELILPPAARTTLGGKVHPQTLITKLTTESIEAVMWLALILLVWRILTVRPLHRREPGDGEVRARLRLGGGSTLAFMATWPGNRHWQDSLTGAIVAYRDVAGVALTLSEPFGAPQAELLPVVRRFNLFADSQGLIPVWYAVTASAFGPVARELEWQSVEVARESIVDVRQWQTRGRKWQDVRSALSRAEREDVTAEWTTWADLTAGAYAQIVDLSQDWVSGHPLPEMGFTLGGLDELRDPEVRLMVAYGPKRHVQGVLSWLPSWRDGRVIGWTLDVMRKRHDAMPGIMEFLIARSAMRMKDDGMEFMSLSGAPLAHDDRGQTVDDASPTDRAGDLYDLLDYLGNTLEPVYGFSSLHHFKQKFQPEVRPWLMVFSSTMNLPAIGLAVVRSYLPHLSVAQALRAIRELGDRSASTHNQEGN